MTLIFIAACASTTGETPATKSKDIKFRCNEASDCASTCGSGCVSNAFAANYKDPCVNVRAFDCSCENSVCYTDGKAPK